jgi:hypothetical protein
MHIYMYVYTHTHTHTHTTRLRAVTLNSVAPALGNCKPDFLLKIVFPRAGATLLMMRERNLNSKP